MRPSSVDTANPMLSAAPENRRPTWNVATVVRPNDEAVRLDLRLVLRFVAHIRVAGQPEADELSRSPT